MKKKYNTQFSQYIKAGIGAENLTKLYESVHAAIRNDPTPKKKEKKKVEVKEGEKKRN